MKLKPLKSIHVLLAFGVIGFGCLLRLLNVDFAERLELMTYDARVRYARQVPAPVATNLAFVYIDENTIEHVRRGTFGYHYGLYWPRAVYGHLVRELADQGAKLVGFDVIFGEHRVFDSAVQLTDGTMIDSDPFFAQEMRRATNVVLAVTHDLTPPEMFLTNAFALGDISTDKDPDGILRKARAFRTYRKWHPAFLQVEADPGYGVDLKNAKFDGGKVILPRLEGEPIEFPLDDKGNFDLADFVGDKIPPGMARYAKPFTEERAWHMGLVLAAKSLGLDLDHAQIDLAAGRITLRGPAGLTRVIPVDAHGDFLIDWCLPPNHPALLRQPAHTLLNQAYQRLSGSTNRMEDPLRAKLVFVGSSALANDLTDRGATPLAHDTLLVSKHWNVANSILTGRFVTRSGLGLDLLLIAGLGVLSALLTWLPTPIKAKPYLRALLALSLLLLLVVAYVYLAAVLYAHHRVWIAVTLPVVTAVLTQLALLSWRVVFEEAERRRVRAVFSKMVSPKIVNELLAAETLSLGGAKVEVTVFFADVRGFTELTVRSQERVAEHVRLNKLVGSAAEACFDQQARETLETVNAYLGLVAKVVIENDGTLDKFIGDCVMAFWGAPKSNPRHAAACVRAAIQAQRAVAELNAARREENAKREQENQVRAGEGRPLLPLLPALSLGSGINTGPAIAGLMGSAEADSMSYTVFGREVNLASRLEGASGHGRIYISQSTHEHLVRDDPALAAQCVPMSAVRLKGFAEAVAVYEVPWQDERLRQPGQFVSGQETLSR